MLTAPALINIGWPPRFTFLTYMLLGRHLRLAGDQVQPQILY